MVKDTKLEELIEEGIDDLKELLDYIMKNNSWKEMSYYNCNRKQPKYLDFKK